MNLGDVFSHKNPSLTELRSSFRTSGGAPGNLNPTTFDDIGNLTLGPLVI